MSLAGVADRARPVAAPASRAELLSVERLEERARLLARTYVVDPSSGRRPLNVGRHFRDDMRVLAHAYKVLTNDARDSQFISSAGEWLLDNFHVIAGEARQARHHLPRGYARHLPTIVEGPEVGQARVVALAADLVRHSDSRLDADQLRRFLNSFQTVSPLTIGELWAWPSALALALVASLRAAASDVLVARAARRAADADFAARQRPKRRLAPDWPATLHPAHLVQLLHRLREYTPWRGDVEQAIERHLASRQLTNEDVIRTELQRQAAMQVSVANAITSLRLCCVARLARVLRVGQPRRADAAARSGGRVPAHGFSQPRPSASGRRADCASIGRRSSARGGAVGRRRARVRAALARRRIARRTSAIHLIDRGRTDFERRARGRLRPRLVARNCRPAFGGAAVSRRDRRDHGRARRGRRDVRRPPRGAADRAHRHGDPAAHPDERGRSLARAAAGALDGRAATAVCGSTSLAACRQRTRTMVIVPTMLTSVANVHALVEHVEVLALANLDPNIHFAILSDFEDAATRERPGDAAILDAAREGVAALAARFGPDSKRFFFFHRDRPWNAQRAGLDGLGAQARQDRGVQPRCSRGATDTSFVDPDRRARCPAVGALLPHARLATRSCRATPPRSSSASSRIR